jgi:hypothetical protein
MVSFSSTIMLSPSVIPFKTTLVTNVSLHVVLAQLMKWNNWRQGFPTPVTGLVVRQAGYWSGSLPPGRKTDRQAEKTDRHVSMF